MSYLKNSNNDLFSQEKINEMFSNNNNFIKENLNILNNEWKWKIC